MALLAIRQVEKRFGGLRAVQGVSMDVAEGELVGGVERVFEDLDGRGLVLGLAAVE